MIQLANITVRHNNSEVFKNLSLTIESGQHLGITGPADSGKTELIRVLNGEMSITEGCMDMPYARAEKALLTPGYQFKNRAGIGELFYQQRFNSTMMQDVPTVQEVLNTSAEQSNPGYWNLDNVSQLLKLEHLIDEEVIKLSNGETKRLRIAILLLKNPKLLLLQDPLIGLDTNARKDFTNVLEQISASGIQMIMTLDHHETPPLLSKIITMDQHQIVGSYSPNEFDTIPQARSNSLSINKEMLQQLVLQSEPKTFDHIVQMNNVNIRYDAKQILENITWTVQQGDKWALLGPNGSGKSTLLSLINGDNPQAYANDITLFDRKKGSGETIWDTKAKIGFVSPELLHYFKTTQNCLHVILSGLREGPFARKLTPTDESDALNWMRLLQIDSYSKQLFKNSSIQVQRLVLLCRALIKKPSLLILDEPCQGLDQSQTENIRQIIDQISHLSNITLIYVTHYKEEIPSCVNQVIELKDGKRI